MSSTITPLDFYLLRLPVRPISEVWQLHTLRTMAELADAIYVRYQAPELQEAIYLASPEFYQQLLKWLSYPSARCQPEDERLVLTLYKYLLRMSSRCTPYGLFAGFATGAVAAAPTQLQLAPASGRYHKHARLDMNYVAELSRQVLADSAVKTKLTYFVNNSLYKVQNTYRYYECSLRNKQRHYYLVAVKASSYLDKLIAAAQPGATHAQLLALLVAHDIAPDVANAFLERLVQAQILVSDLEPTVTGPEFYRHLVDRVADLSPEYRHLPELQAVTRLLDTPDTTVATYRAVQDTVHTCFSAATSKDLIQADLRLQMTHNTLSQAAVAHLSADLHALAALYKAAPPTDLQTFIKSFVERYEDQEIPLLEALDSEAGLGYGIAAGAKANHAPLLQGLRMPGKPSSQKITWSAYRQLVFRKFQEGHASRTPVRISDEELAAVADGKAPKLPATFFAMGSFVATDAQALDQGNFAFQLITCHGPGAMTVLARFAHAEPALAAKLAACGEQEQQAYGEDAVLAEVVHLPEARIGNLLQRPQLRRYEIPFLGNASVPLDQQIPVADLLISVRQGQIVLRSKRLNKIVIPRLTTAHYYRDGLSIYKFLCDLQQQQEPFSILWDWGVLQQQPYLPRVEYKRIIVTRARWRLPRTAHAAVQAIQTPEQLLAFREQYGLPERVLLADNDKELLLDFTCPLALPLLAQALKQSPVLLYEFLHDQPSQLVEDDQQQPYLNEVVIPLMNSAAHVRQPAVLPAAATTPPVQRTFTLGSEWTYLKVYCGARWADKILTEHLLPCLEELEEQQLVQQWFFIRYVDPKSHLRLRLRHTPDTATLAAILERLHRALDGLQQQRVIQAVQYDTYQRELERYGTATMPFSETVFYHDSQAVIRFLNLLEGDEGERYRWLFAVRGVDALLDDFGLTLPEKLRVAEQTQHSFFTEFHGNAALTRQLNDKYRSISRLLTEFLNPANDTDYIQEAVDLFTTRSTAIRRAYTELQEVFAERYPSISLPAAVRRLLPSYLHMFLNRIFIANQRLHELVVYHYLVKYYTSQLARNAHPVPAAV